MILLRHSATAAIASGKQHCGGPEARKSARKGGAEEEEQKQQGIQSKFEIPSIVL